MAAHPAEDGRGAIVHGLQRRNEQGVPPRPGGGPPGRSGTHPYDDKPQVGANTLDRAQFPAPPTPHGGIGRTPPLSSARNKGGRSTAFRTSRRWPWDSCPTVSLSPLSPGENKRMTLGILGTRRPSRPDRRVRTVPYGKEGRAHCCYSPFTLGFACAHSPLIMMEEVPVTL